MIDQIVAVIFLLILIGWVSYMILMGLIARNWRTDHGAPNISILPSVAVVICARNEAGQIHEVLSDLAAQVYHGVMDVFVVDDHSTDRTAEIVSTQFPEVRLVELSTLDIPSQVKGFKKWGIDHIIRQVDHEIIVSTDADCRMGPQWLSTLINGFTKPNRDVVVGPVLGEGRGSFIEQFQRIEYAATQGATAFGIESGWFYSGGGANLAYRRKKYLELDPYRSNLTVTSGDDVFLLESFVNAKSGIAYVYNRTGVVYTALETNARDLINQRRRWSAKSKAYQQSNLNILWIYLICFNLLLLFGLPFFLLAGRIIFFFLTGVMLAFKLRADYKITTMILESFEQRIKISAFLLAAGYYPIFLTQIAYAFIMRRSFTWKNRVFER